MTIAEHSGWWPPSGNADIGRSAGPKLKDAVQSAKTSNHKGRIILNCRTASGMNYQAVVSVPESLVDPAIFLINQKKGISLNDLGDLQL